jgi:hypothetical protein
MQQEQCHGLSPTFGLTNPSQGSDVSQLFSFAFGCSSPLVVRWPVALPGEVTEPPRGKDSADEAPLIIKLSLHCSGQLGDAAQSSGHNVDRTSVKEAFPFPMVHLHVWPSPLGISSRCQSLSWQTLLGSNAVQIARFWEHDDNRSVDVFGKWSCQSCR